MQKLTLATLSALALSLTCSRVFAVDGTITVNGVVTDGTCILHSAGGDASGTKDLTLTLPTVPKSKFNTMSVYFMMELRNADGTGVCDAATSYALKGIHLSAISPTDLDVDDKTLLVNKAADVSIKNPIFIQIETDTGVGSARQVDFSAPWGTQAKSIVFHFGLRTAVTYYINYAAKNWIVDAQTVQAKINYTLHYN